MSKEKAREPMSFGYAAATLKDIAAYIRTYLKFDGRSHRSRGMKNPHDAYAAGYNDGLEEAAQVIEMTRLTGEDEKGQ